MVRMLRMGKKIIVEYKDEKKAEKFFDLLAPLIYDGFIPDAMDGEDFSLEDIIEESNEIDGKDFTFKEIIEVTRLLKK